MTTHFDNPVLAAMSYDDMIQHVAAAQANTAKAVSTHRRRSREEFSKFMLKARTLIREVQTNVPILDQAKLLTQHQIKAALQGTSTYTPFIKLLFGKLDEGGKKAKFAGEEHVKWIPDESFGRYFNFFEFIDREYRGAEEDLLKFVLELGGPSAIVNKELERKREERKPTSETVESYRDLYLTETNMPVIDLPPDALGETEDFLSVILQRREGSYRLVGVSKKDAAADFDRMASASFEALTKAKAEREALADRQRELDDAKETGAREAAEGMAAKMGMSVEEMRQRIREMAEAAKAKVEGVGAHGQSAA